jgi:hypothetical protein
LKEYSESDQDEDGEGSEEMIERGENDPIHGEGVEAGQ